MGTLTVTGGVYQAHRGPNGVNWGSSERSGYLMSMFYDARLGKNPPPNFVEPSEALTDSAWMLLGVRAGGTDMSVYLDRAGRDRVRRARPPGRFVPERGDPPGAAESVAAATGQPLPGLRHAGPGQAQHAGARVARAPWSVCGLRRAPISGRYPLVEAGTGATFALLGATFADSWALPALLYLAAAGIALAVIDLDTHRLPDVIVLSSCVVVLALLVGSERGRWHLGRTRSSGARRSGVVGAVPRDPARLARRDGRRRRQARRAARSHDRLARVGSLGRRRFRRLPARRDRRRRLMSAGRAGRKTAIPFGPFLITGAFVAVFAGAPLADAYLELITVAMP